MQPLATVPGGPCLKEYRILPNKREILTRDSVGNVALWSVLFVSGWGLNGRGQSGCVPTSGCVIAMCGHGQSRCVVVMSGCSQSGCDIAMSGCGQSGCVVVMSGCGQSGCVVAMNGCGQSGCVPSSAQAKKLRDLGEVDLQEEVERRGEELYTPNWFSVELKTGVGVKKREEMSGEGREEMGGEGREEMGGEGREEMGGEGREEMGGEGREEMGGEGREEMGGEGREEMGGEGREEMGGGKVDW